LVLLYHAAPKASYTNYATFDGEDFDGVHVGGGASTHVESSAKYLGSWLSPDGKDTMNVKKRIKQASGAPGSLLKCVFKRKDVTSGAKVAVYNPLVLSIVLCGSESRALTQKHRDKPRGLNRRCVRSMCHINMWHVMCRSTASLRRSSKTAWACGLSGPTWYGGGFGG
jgi:hypothetical protein